MRPKHRLLLLLIVRIPSWEVKIIIKTNQVRISVKRR